MKIEEIVPTARRTGKAKASSWRAVRDDKGRVIVWHYATAMLWVLPDGTPEPLSRGWGSSSDKRGVRKVLAGVGLDMGYNDFYRSF